VVYQLLLLVVVLPPECIPLLQGCLHLLAAHLLVPCLQVLEPD
jgi:hypothetical protein